MTETCESIVKTMAQLAVLAFKNFCSDHIIIIWMRAKLNLHQSSISIDSIHVPRADSRLAPSQWETSLQCNAVSHWLGANLESALCVFFSIQYPIVFSRTWAQVWTSSRIQSQYLMSWRVTRWPYKLCRAAVLRDPFWTRCSNGRNACKPSRRSSQLGCWCRRNGWNWKR